MLTTGKLSTTGMTREPMARPTNRARSVSGRCDGLLSGTEILKYGKLKILSDEQKSNLNNGAWPVSGT